MRHIIDTGVLWRPEALGRLETLPDELILPAVVFLERARQLVQRGRTTEEFQRWLELAGFEVEPFGVAEALRYGARFQDEPRWRRLARDAMIAGHVGENDVLWTTNPVDFIAIGVPKGQIVVV